MKRRAALLALALAALWALTVPALAAQDNRSTWLIQPVLTYDNSYTDIGGAWYEESAIVCYESGLMSGVGGGVFSGAGTLTYEQLAAVCARLLEQLTGNTIPAPVPDPSLPWYRHYYDYLGDAFDLPAEGLLQRYYPGVTANRASFAGLLFQTLNTSKTSLPAINRISALPDTSDSSVLFLYNAGILTGQDSIGTFGGERSLSRAEAAAMLARVVVPALRQTYTLHYTAPRYDLCADVLQMDPDTVLITVDDYEFTAELVAAELTRAVILRQPSTLSSEVPTALREYFGRRAAIYRLAAIKRLELTAAELRACEAQGAEKDGVNGLSANAWAEQARYEMLLNRLLQFYLYFYPGEQLSTNLHEGRIAQELSLAMNPMQLTTTPAFDSLDYAAIRERAVASPLYDMYS